MTTDRPINDPVEDAMPTAMHLAIVVHDRDQEGVADILGPLRQAGDWDQAMALLVALAALVPVDQSAADLLAWVLGPHVPDELYAEIVDLVRPGHKRCARCREVWPFREFNRDRSKSDGYKARCRSCLAEARLEAPSRGEGAA